ncbi:hypothetical protein QFC21_001449 [Naganishia friedmannii]|uniref:Uncharacterized protein n=1 Tax=Naganishia friedmannii TaxID=89922 RepID=A0ACC2W540_9TREE|nr:hypothetical protein QFC21_001449 [Naganishia friedmannii]
MSNPPLTEPATSKLASAQRARFSPESVDALVNSLDRLRLNQPKAVSQTAHVYAPLGSHKNDTGSQDEGVPKQRIITSWKMQEHLYRRKDCPFPTLARGLFTATEDFSLQDRHEIGKSGKKIRIVARGYDKFFNIGEVPWTEWDNLAKYSEAPYDLTYKSNGCLILVSAISESEILVTSKHSLGTTILPKDTAHPNTSVTPSNGQPPSTKPQETPSTTTSVAATKTVAPDSTESVPVFDLSTKSGQKKAAKHAAKEAKKVDKANADRDRDLYNQTAKEEAEAKKHEVHANGGSDSAAPAHAEMGKRWLKQTLEKVDRTESDLAKELWERNLTAVTELCDDDFEEHVLSTPQHLTGLHLHGLNLNTPYFATLSPEKVKVFAREWGFIPTDFERLNTLDEVKQYADKVAKEGKWKGEAIEGFVVRTTVKEINSKSDDGEPPYPPGSPFFFKIKFEEPYLMYRQWREITRSLMPLLKETCPGRRSREAFPWTQMGSKLKRPESAVYAEWCAEMMVKEPPLFDNYDKGVVRVRERFLQWTEGDGKSKWQAARKNSEHKAPKDAAKKAIIVPVAVPGCGKTILGVALGRLFGFAHTQNDDIKQKKTAATFLKNIVELLKKNDVVYCDRNNHLPKHHEELSDLAVNQSFEDHGVRRIALVWDIDSHPYNKALRITSERILSRGENHQSLRPDPADQMRHEAVIRMFMSDFVPPEGGLFDDTIKLGLENNLEQNLRIAADGLCAIMPQLHRPTDAEISKALEEAKSYKPSVKKELQGKETPPPRYYGLSIELDLKQYVGDALASNSSAKEDIKRDAQQFLGHLVANGRIVARPHVTIVHEKTVQEETPDGAAEISSIGPARRLWTTCEALRKMPSPALFEFDLTALLFNDRVMTLVVDHVRPHPVSSSAFTPSHSREQDTGKVDRQHLLDVEKALCEDLKEVLHVTVGTREEGIQPYEARGLVEAWRKGDDSVKLVNLKDLSGIGRVMGMS